MSRIASATRFSAYTQLALPSACVKSAETRGLWEPTSTIAPPTWESAANDCSFVCIAAIADPDIRPVSVRIRVFTPPAGTGVESSVAVLGATLAHELASSCTPTLNGAPGV